MRSLTTELTLLKQQVESQEEKHWSEITKMKTEHEQTVRYLKKFFKPATKVGWNFFFSALKLDSTISVKQEPKLQLPMPKTLKNLRKSKKNEKSEVGQ